LTGAFALGDGVRVQRLQHWTFPVPVRRAAESVELDITNAGGRMVLEMIEVGAAPLPTSRVSGT
jgi:hypothetical protein